MRVCTRKETRCRKHLPVRVETFLAVARGPAADHRIARLIKAYVRAWRLLMKLDENCSESYRTSTFIPKLQIELKDTSTRGFAQSVLELGRLLLLCSLQRTIVLETVASEYLTNQQLKHVPIDKS
ncbi:uncharacterized protein LOC135433807 [Drosophila montana]|uniref:uncharacterized protein LOC135433807 n=1 Tax=Drosophila montana TaxID=40370 RepID=UPI00313AD8F9